MTHLKLTEENEKKQDFRHWSDAGREWREIVLQGTVLNRYRSLKNGKILYEDFSHMALSCLDSPDTFAMTKWGAKTEMKNNSFMLSIKILFVQAVVPRLH